MTAVALKSEGKFAPQLEISHQGEVNGVDITIRWQGASRNPQMLGPALEDAAPEEIELLSISQKGADVYPGSWTTASDSDQWCCRFVAADHGPLAAPELYKLQILLKVRGFEIEKIQTW
ncbi:MAG: hypothetical protein ACO3NW_11305 [Kiritimatiellia bacterium]